MKGLLSLLKQVPKVIKYGKYIIAALDVLQYAKIRFESIGENEDWKITKVEEIENRNIT